MSAFYIGGKVCSRSKCVIQVNKVGLKPTYPIHVNKNDGVLVHSQLAKRTNKHTE